MRKGNSTIIVKKASEYQDFPREDSELEEESDKKDLKLLNVIYFENEYYLFEPRNKGETKSNIIDNHLWLVCKFMPDVCAYS